MRRGISIAGLFGLCAFVLFAALQTGCKSAKSDEIPITTKSKEARELFIEARKLAEFQHTEKANEIFAQAVEKDPEFAMGYLFNWFVIAERLRKTTLAQNAVTLPQFIAELFNEKGFAFRALPVIIITLAMLGYVAAQMNAAGKAFEATFQLPYEGGVIAGAVIILTYTLTGGFRAICWTDVIQATFMVVALLVMPFVVMFDVGGFRSAITALEAADPQLLTITGRNVGFAALGGIVGYLGIGLGYPGQPHVLARFMGT